MLTYDWTKNGGQVIADETRDKDLAAENYEVLSLRPKAIGYFPEVQKLVEKIAIGMAESEKFGWEFSTTVENASYVEPPEIDDSDIPF